MSNTTATARLYYDDAYLRAFDAQVLDASPDRKRIYLDRTAFYPASGGQPFDTGLLGGVRVAAIEDEEERVAHILDAPLLDQSVRGEVDWGRRFDHMQQHTGQHLLSAVFADLFHLQTLSFHMGAVSSTIDLACPAVSGSQLEAVESRVNELIVENRPVLVSYEDATSVTGLRKASERTGTLRLVTIDGLDRSACGGTHVRATGEIGVVLLRGVEKVRGNMRVEFVCGGRAVRRARADYNALTAIARTFSSAIDDTPSLVSAQSERLQDAGKTARRLAGEIAALRGRELYAQTPADANGLRIHVSRLETTGIDESVRGEAQAFTSGSRGVYIAAVAQPAAILVAAAANSGVHAGNLMKEVLAEVGGRGGGAAQLAQGSVPSREALEDVLSRVRVKLAAG